MLGMDGWMDGARMWHACMTSFLHVLCAILVEKKKSRTISVVLTDLEPSLTLIVDAICFSEQAALFNQVSEAAYSQSCYMKQWRVSHFWREERDPPHLVCGDGLNPQVSWPSVSAWPAKLLVVKLCHCQVILPPGRTGIWCELTLCSFRRSCRRKWFPVVFLSSKRGDRWRCCGRYVANVSRAARLKRWVATRRLWWWCSGGASYYNARYSCNQVCFLMC